MKSKGDFEGAINFFTTNQPKPNKNSAFPAKRLCCCWKSSPPQKTEYMKVSHEMSWWSSLMETIKPCKMTGSLTAPLEVISKWYRLLREDNEERVAYHRHEAMTGMTGRSSWNLWVLQCQAPALAGVMHTGSGMQNQLLWQELQLCELLSEHINEILLWDYQYNMESPRRIAGTIAL